MSHRSEAQLLAAEGVVFVVDDDEQVRKSLETLLHRAGWQAKTFSSAEEFLAYPRPPIPNCLVSDISLPDLHGLRLQRMLADRPELPVIFMTSRVDMSVVVQAMKGGAAEFLIKPIIEEGVVNAVRQALERSGEALQRETEIAGIRQRYASLSCRERQVMGLIVQGLMNKQVGAELGISIITVKAHRGNVMRKMDARSVAELVTMALSLELVPVRSRARPYAAKVQQASRLSPSHPVMDAGYPLAGGIGAFAGG